MPPWCLSGTVVTGRAFQALLLHEYCSMSAAQPHNKSVDDTKLGEAFGTC